ncbi:3-dehydroquinate dehydratase [Brevibacterium sanguinis]|uniref:3-dehydroquinate dehydratase n=2 Tax=Brevibacterium TaxID=1696 RepID=A0A366INY1_9MICO|nr:MULTISPECIES: type I 3-dehydroquinate dehydratase [Brevibacterium]RBP67074.1 3-dehydroquinate dehydratase [Brevibacterium sanguinis]RBP73599.1 3-dehydroquinate dehydratase [Brevibacterium celere]
MKPLPFLSTPPNWSPATTNRRRPAVIVPLQSTTGAELAAYSSRAAATGLVDVIEWRIDPLGPRSEAILELAPQVLSAGLPVLVTLRTAGEGGAAEVTDEEYREILSRTVPELSGSADVPVALDVEIARRGADELIAHAHEHGVAVVASHHNFTATDSPADLGATFDRMAAAGADVAKIAMTPGSAHDVTTVLEATAEADARLDCSVLGISMGQLGRATRILGADFGSCATFAQLGLASAPGQIDVAELAAILDSLYG